MKNTLIEAPEKNANGSLFSQIKFNNFSPLLFFVTTFLQLDLTIFHLLFSLFCTKTTLLFWCTQFCLCGGMKFV